jgi:nucleoside-diphosphate-sugar epimerase
MEMARLLILSATGSLGRQLLQQSLAAGHEVTVFVRTPSRLPPEAVGRVAVHTGDLSTPVHGPSTPPASSTGYRCGFRAASVTR